jgi:L-aspartate oxidase
MDERTTDVLVVGAGIAGLAAALEADRQGADVTVATKAERPEDASTWWAQGGIAVTRDDPEQFAGDIREASAGTADADAVETLVAEADDAVRDILVDTLGIEFDTNESAPDGASDRRATLDAGYDYGQEAAHDEPRILHVNAATGKHVHVPFLNYVAEETDVTILEDTAALDLIRHEGRVYGAVLESDGEWAPTFAGATVLATGGIGALYPRSTNPADATGDGIAMAALAGADVADMEYVQFHPTAYDGEGDDTFLVSEAVRGEGAVLRNGEGERFMPDYHDDAELAPRDVVARAVDTERERTGEVVLDVSGIEFETEFPDLAAKCRDHGVDLPEIPVAPAEHFLCGGIDVDDRGRASLDRLWAVGECARTGVHGANRLASTSLLEGLVWGRRAGENAAGHDFDRIEPPELLDSDPALPDNFAREKMHRLRRVMDEQVGIERTPDGLRRAQSVLRRLKGEVDAYVRTRTSRSLYELRSAAVVALLVARAAAENEESVGCHYLVEETDAPAVDAD